MDARVYELLNDQINKELYSSYLYLSFADYYEEEGLEGFANWYEIQAKEERDHALIFRNYLHENGCKVNLLAIGAVFLILLLMKRQLLLPVILVLSIETAIWINLAIPYFRGRHVFYIAYLIISTIQLGATVDYAILFSDRYQEFRETLGKKQAIAATVSTVTTSVITTGSALAVVGFLMGAISTNQLLGQLGNFLGVGGLVSLAIVLLALPGYLYLADPLIIKPKKQPKEA